jgi:hypothetical protein
MNDRSQQVAVKRRIPGLQQSERDAVERGDDNKSTNEAVLFSRGPTLKQVREECEKNEALRNDAFKEHFERLAIFSLYIAWAAWAIMGVVLVGHLVTPVRLHFVTSEQMNALQPLVFAGGFAAIAGDHIKRRIGNPNQDSSSA